MARVEITERLEEEIKKKFKKDSKKIFKLMCSLEDNPKKGKLLGVIGGIALKEIKYKSFRFYFVADKQEILFLEENQLNNLLIKFVRMSHKKQQQETINEIRKILINICPKGL